MRIERISLDNINSLGGHFELDLTHPSLTDSGIFVITGPTGSGKTTLLDAITYAIYGQTVRQGRLTGSSNEIMTHGSSFCRAEAVVEKDGVRYLFSTEQKRRKVRVAGNDPFSTAERRISRLEADGTLSLLASAKGAVDKFAASLMKYENFCRCMMLAQGEFSRFLKADARERSETLATITGTEIYQSIGDRVQTRVAKLRAAMDAVALLPVLDAEARAAAEQRRDEQDARCREWQAAVEELNRIIAWHGALEQAENTRHACATALEQAQAALQQFAEAGHPARIKAAEAAQGIHAQEVCRNNSARALRELQHKLSSEQDWLDKHPGGELKKAAEDTARELETQRPELEARLKFIAEEVQPREDAIRSAGVKAREATRSAEKRAEEARTAHLAAQQMVQAAERAAEVQRLAEEALAQCVADAVLSEALPAIRQRLEDWKKSSGAHTLLPDAETIAARVVAEAAERARLLGGRRREELPLRLERLNKIRELHSRKKETLEQARKLAFAKEAADKARASLPSVEEAEQVWKKADERARTAFKILDFSTKLNELYLDFCAGKMTHCPCCGSPEPHERQVLPEQELENARRAARAAQVELTRRQKAHADAQEQYVAARASCKVSDQAVSAICSEYQNALGELGWEEIPENIGEQIETLKAALRRLEELDGLAGELFEWQRQDACRSALHEALRPCTQELPAQLGEATVLVRRLSDKLKAYNRACEQKNEAIGKLSIARERAALAQQEAQKSQQRQAGAQREAENAQQELGKRQRELAEIWQGDTAQKASAALQATLGALQKKHNESKDALNHFLVERESHAAQAREAERQQPLLRQQAEQDADQFSEALRQHGFPDEGTYAAAMMPGEELTRLRAQQATLHQRIAGAEGASKQAEGHVETLRSQKLSNATAEEDARKREELGEVLREQQNLLTEQLAILRQDDDARRANAQKEAALADTRQELARWQRLYEILGGTKDGFKKYAQRITFNLLLAAANERLRLLSERYTLLQDTREELGLRVIDRYQDDEQGRSCSNLSGGESFIVSLALALGLAQMAGETRIDTLFLDEGFGTLDEDALEQVLTCLQSLRAGGKLIGIISHVEALKERIPANIELLPRGATGLSTMASHAAVVAEPR